MDFDLSKPQKLLQQSARDLLAENASRSACAKQSPAKPRMTTRSGAPPPIRSDGAHRAGAVRRPGARRRRACGFDGGDRPRLHARPALLDDLRGAVIARLNDAGLQARWLEPLAAGTLRATVAVLDKSANWDLETIRGKAEKHFVTDAAVADVILAIVRDGAELAVVLLERGAEGVTITRTPSMDETRKLYTVAFESGKAAAAATALQSAIDTATVALCAEMVGGMQWILDTTVAVSIALWSAVARPPLSLIRTPPCTIASLIHRRRAGDGHPLRAALEQYHRELRAIAHDGKNHISHGCVGDEVFLCLSANGFEIPIRALVEHRDCGPQRTAASGSSQRACSPASLRRPMSAPAKIARKSGPGMQARPVSSIKAASSTTPSPRPPNCSGTMSPVQRSAAALQSASSSAVSAGCFGTRSGLHSLAKRSRADCAGVSAVC